MFVDPRAKRRRENSSDDSRAERHLFVAPVGPNWSLWQAPSQVDVYEWTSFSWRRHAPRKRTVQYLRRLIHFASRRSMVSIQFTHERPAFIPPLPPARIGSKCTDNGEIRNTVNSQSGRRGCRWQSLRWNTVQQMFTQYTLMLAASICRIRHMHQL